MARLQKDVGHLLKLPTGSFVFTAETVTHVNHAAMRRDSGSGRRQCHSWDYSDVADIIVALASATCSCTAITLVSK